MGLAGLAVAGRADGPARLGAIGPLRAAATRTKVTSLIVTLLGRRPAGAGAGAAAGARAGASGGSGRGWPGSGTLGRGCDIGASRDGGGGIAQTECALLGSANRPVAKSQEIK